MNSSLFFLTTFGEWIEQNIFSLVSLLITMVGLIIWLVRLEGRVNANSKGMENMEKTMAEQDKDLRVHTTDNDRHVNHLHMRAMEKRIDQIDNRMDKMEVTMSQGFEKTLSRIDTLIRRD